MSCGLDCIFLIIGSHYCSQYVVIYLRRDILNNYIHGENRFCNHLFYLAVTDMGWRLHVYNVITKPLKKVCPVAALRI